MMVQVSSKVTEPSISPGHSVSERRRKRMAKTIRVRAIPTEKQTETTTK